MLLEKFVTFKTKLITMKTKEILYEINRLPISERFYLVEKTIETIRKDEEKRNLCLIVEEMVEEYKTNPELSAFKNIDFEDFYEAK
jgi:hypothetical protein